MLGTFTSVSGLERPAKSHFIRVLGAERRCKLTTKTGEEKPKKSFAMIIPADSIPKAMAIHSRFVLMLMASSLFLITVLQAQIIPTRRRRIGRGEATRRSISTRPGFLGAIVLQFVLQ